MPRQPTWGTPGRSEHYQKLRSKYVLVTVGLALGTFAFVPLVLLQLVGFRSPLSPGSVTSGHSGVDTRCEACHTARSASDLRCQRCHDGGGAGRLTLPAHVFFGSGDAGKASRSGARACARCHVEHRGRAVRLAAVDQGNCLECHAAWRPAKAGQAFRIGSLAQHPEFQVLREKMLGDPRLLFSHKRHMKEMIKEGAAGEWDTCVRCHTPEPEGRDLLPIDYERHCARCHSESELTMDPVSAQDVEVDVPLPGAVGALNRSPDGATVQRLGIRHKDDWVLYNLRKLQWELYPGSYARDRDNLLARADRLERRLFQAQPLSGLTLDALRARESQVREELKRLEERQRAQAASAEGPSAGLGRLADVSGAAAQSGDEEARAAAAALLRDSEAMRGAASGGAAIPLGELELRRQELFGLLETLATADPGRKRTIEDLRRRLLALSPGETAAEAVARAIGQRRVDLDRIADEISLRTSYVPVEARALPEQIALQRELKGVRDQLAKFYGFAGAPPALDAADRTRKLDVLLKLSGAGTLASGKGERCAKCHMLTQGSLVPQRAARSVMVRATFAHRSHLDAPLPEPSLVARLTSFWKSKPATGGGPARSRCAYCHESIPAAADAPRPPAIPGVASCRECHREGAARQDCLICHRYHPAAGPS
jgi:hypothetical protein